MIRPAKYLLVLVFLFLPASQTLASLEVLQSPSETDADEKTGSNDADAILEGLRNLGSGVQTPPDTGPGGDSSGDPFGDGIGLLAMGDAAAPPGDSAVPPDDAPPPPLDEMTFVPDEENGGGTRTFRNGKGQIVREQTEDKDGNVTGFKEFYPDTGAEKTVQEQKGANMTVIHQYDPPEENEKRGVERVTESRDKFGGTRIQHRDRAGRITSAINTTPDGEKTVTIINPDTNKPTQSTSTYPNGNLKSTLTYEKDGSASGTNFGEDGETPTGRVTIDSKGNKTTTNFDADGNVRETTVHNKDGILVSRQTPNPDGTTTTTTFHKDGREMETKVENAAGQTLRSETPGSHGYKNVTHFNEDGSVRESTVVDEIKGEVRRREIPNPDGSVTVQEYPGEGQPPKTRTIHPGQ